MGQFEDLRTFVEIVDRGGVARAAATLGIAKSAVSRRLKLLEDRFGVQLIDRQPGVWELTDAGQELFQRAAGVVAAADDLDADFSSSRQSLDGPLSVSLPNEFGLGFLSAFLLQFQIDHPGIQLTLDFDDRYVDLDRENYDLAVRIAERPDPEVISRSIGLARHGLYCGVAYAQSRALPQIPEELMKHRLLHHGAARRATWDLYTDAGKTAVSFQPVLNATSGQYLMRAAQQGLGIARLPSFIVGDAVSDGRLVQVLPKVTLPDLGISVVYSKKRLLSRRMRVFIDQIVAACVML